MGDGNLNTSKNWPPVSSQHGKVAALDLDGVIVLVASTQAQTWNDYAIRSCGIMPENQTVIAVKSTVHFRHCFEKYAAKIYEIWSPGLSEQLVSKANLTRTRRPIYPLDEM